MNESYYSFSRIEDRVIFEFESISDAKSIKKIIEFRLINQETTLYNIALVDILPDGSASDLSVSNNQDMPKVLATVFQSIHYFFKEKPTAKILIQGSTPSRTRLYQIAIVKYLEEIEPKFYIWGFMDNVFEEFTKGKNYDGFIVAHKSNLDEK